MPSLSGPCLREIINLMLVRASSVNLSPEVFNACFADLGKYCSPQRRNSSSEEITKGLNEGYNYGGEEEKLEESLSCLEDHIDQLQVCR